MVFSFYEDFMMRRYKRLEKMYDMEIREECDSFKIILDDCMKRVKNEKECTFNISKFDECVKNFDKKFKLYHKL